MRIKLATDGVSLFDMVESILGILVLTTVPFKTCYYLPIYVLINVIIHILNMFSTCCTSVYYRQYIIDSKIVTCNNLFILVFGMTLYGCVTYWVLPLECQDTYKNDYGELWVYFLVNVWLYMILSGLIVFGYSLKLISLCFGSRDILPNTGNLFSSETRSSVSETRSSVSETRSSVSDSLPSVSENLANSSLQSSQISNPLLSDEDRSLNQV